MPGASRTLSKKGTRLKKLSTVGKNPLNSRKKPYVSTQNPMMAQPHTTSANPAQNSAEPCAEGIPWTSAVQPRQSSMQTGALLTAARKGHFRSVMVTRWFFRLKKNLRVA